MNEYEEIRDRVANELRPKFEAGELRGWIESDHVKMEEEEHRRDFEPPLWRLEAECAKRLRSNAEAFVVLLHSPFAGTGWEQFEMDYGLRQQHHSGKRKASPQAVMLAETRGKAGVALARDLLLIARTRRWYRPARGEEPTTAELRRAA